ncbi:STAS domain-containing protein [Streptomyces sp. NPDC006450]|uniref:STAS domain-containing protein n=1 Tax=Streptomyces sp. NPDC006450 TaxID=3155458 RepID=UPI0033A9C52F
MTASFATAIQYAGTSALVSAVGELDAAAGPALHQVIDAVLSRVSVALIDVHEVSFMDSAGFLYFLDLHRRLESGGLGVVVAGWQPQPQRLMDSIARLPGDGPDSAEHCALIGFRRMIREGAERERHDAARGMRTAREILPHW